MRVQKTSPQTRVRSAVTIPALAGALPTPHLNLSRNGTQTNRRVDCGTGQNHVHRQRDGICNQSGILQFSGMVEELASQLYRIARTAFEEAVKLAPSSRFANDLLR